MGVHGKHVLIVLVYLVHWAEFMHFHVDNTLHVAFFHGIPGNLFRESRKLDRFVKYHKFFMRFKIA